MGQAKIKAKRDFDQKMRYNNGELGLIKNTFADNDEILIAIRKVFLQGELNKLEGDIINGLNDEVLAIIKKEILPDIDLDAPLFQIVDMWATIDFSQDPQKISYALADRQIVVDYLKQQYEILKGGKLIEIRLKDLIYRKEKNPDQAIIDLSARNSIIKHIDAHLNFLKLLAGRKDETPEETTERLMRDSNK